MTLTNTKLSKTSNYTAANADKGKTISLDGSTLFTLTISTMASYDADYSLFLYCEGSAAKDVAVSGLTTFRMYPGDTAIVFNNQTSWAVHRDARHKIPTGVTNMYVNPGGAQTGWAAGSSSNDGLSQLSPKATYQDALQTMYGHFDFNGHGQSQVVINGAPNTTDTVGIHFAPHSTVGAQGGAAVKIVGGTNSAIIPTAGTAIDVFNGGIIQVANMKVASNNGACINSSYGSKIYILGGVELGNAAAYQIGANSLGHVIVQGEVKVSGNAPAFLSNNYGYYEGGGATIKFLNNVEYSWFVLMNFGQSHFGGHTIDLNGFTVQGNRFFVNNNGTCFSATGNPQSFFPGTSNGSTSNGGICL